MSVLNYSKYAHNIFNDVLKCSIYWAERNQEVFLPWIYKDSCSRNAQVPLTSSVLFLNLIYPDLPTCQILTPS